MKSLIFSSVFAVLLVQCIQAYKIGAPKGACIDMVPQHGAPIQTSRLPYGFTFDKKSMNPNEALTIRVQGKDGFKGFLIQVRQESTDQPIGTFIQDDNKKKTFNCVSDNDSITHANDLVKNNLSIKWKSPTNFKNTAIIYATMAKDGGTYWVKQAVGTLSLVDNRIVVEPIAN